MSESNDLSLGEDSDEAMESENECGEQFSTPALWSAGIVRRRRQNDAPQVFMCRAIRCKAVFKTGKGLDRHMRTAHQNGAPSIFAAGNAVVPMSHRTWSLQGVEPTEAHGDEHGDSQDDPDEQGGSCEEFTEEQNE
jgi:uncharacterized C2H2 Zn-finger protein